MSKEPNDMTQTAKFNTDAQSSSKPHKETAQPASNETVADKFMKIASQNPRFKEVKNSEKGFMIVGAKPQQAITRRDQKP